MNLPRTRILGRRFQPILLLPIVLLLKPVLHAQETSPERGNLEIGVRALAGDHDSSQFNEYRDLHSGFFVQDFQASLDHLLHGDYFLTVQTRDSLQKDQRFRVTFGDTGKFKFEFDWDSTPHEFSNSAMTLFTPGSPGVFTIPTAVRNNLINSPASLPTMLQFAAGANTASRRQLGGGKFTYTPNGAWALFLQYSHEKESGYRPFGSLLNSSNMLELPEPTDYRTDELKAGVEYGNSRGGFQAGYSASIFNNQAPALQWQNPFNSVSAVSNSSQGQIALYPDNTAQSLEFAGAVNLSATTRLMAYISPEWMRQNSAFLPYTVNSAVTGVAPLPATSLNGKKTRLAMNYTLASHPVKDLLVTVRYRDYDYINDTPSLLFQNYVQTDSSVNALARQSLPYSFNRQTAGVDATWMLHKGDALTLGYNFENLDRQYRDVAKSQEHTGSVTLDLNPKKWIFFRGSYRLAKRDPQNYDLSRNIDLLDPQGEGATAVAMPAGWELFDEAQRTLYKADALLEVDPTDRLSLTASYENEQDRYNDTIYGMLGNRSGASTIDGSYTVSANVSLIANYAYETYKTDQRSRQYSGPSGSNPANDTTNNDWESYIRDGVNTVGGGVSISGLRRKLAFDGLYSLSMAKGNILNRTLGNPLLPGFLVTTAQDYPETGTRFHTVTAAVRYKLTNSVFCRAEYRLERYDQADFQTAVMTPYMVPLDSKTNTSIFLGASVPGYHVNILSLSLDYRF